MQQIYLCGFGVTNVVNMLKFRITMVYGFCERGYFFFKELEILVLATEHLYLVLFEFLLTVIHLYVDLWWHDYWWTFTRYRSWCKNNLAHHIVHFVCCQVTDISAVIFYRLTQLGLRNFLMFELLARMRTWS